MERLDVVFLDETPEILAAILQAGAGNVEAGFAEFQRELARLQRMTVEFRFEREQDGAIAVADVPFLGHLVIGGGRLFEFVTAIQNTVVNPPAFGTPAAVFDAVGDRPVERRPRRPGLSAGDDFRDHKILPVSRLLKGAVDSLEVESDQGPLQKSFDGE